MTIGEYLRELRGERTLGQISQKSEIDKGYLSKIERDERRPKPSMIENLANAYGADYRKLLEICGYIDEEPIFIRRLRKANDRMDDAQRKKMMGILMDNFQDLFEDEDDEES